MLLVACAVSARTTLVACGDNQACNGFYPSDAMPDGTTEDVVQDVQGCFGFYPSDATLDATQDAADVESDASDASDE